MNSGLSANDLVDFEAEIASEFNAGRIRSPVHLYAGNEAQMLEIFEDIHPDDWVCCSWRSHYQCLLKGVPRDELKAAIMDGKSIALCFPAYRIFSSAIVGGAVPIAVGIAMGLKRSGSAARVHCFMGDMTAECGIAHESMKYAAANMLNIRFIVEDNGMSVCTPTRTVWGSNKPAMIDGAVQVARYGYVNSKYPHSGAGKRVQF